MPRWSYTIVPPPEKGLARHQYLELVGDPSMKQPALQQYAKEAYEQTAYTPVEDVYRLFEQDYHPVFVYDLMKEGMSDHDMLAGNPFFGNALTCAHDFVMYKRNNGPQSFPIPLLAPFDNDRGQIKGELYLCKSKQIITLDEFKVNTVHFNRIKTRVFIPWRAQKDDGKVFPEKKPNMKQIDAFMYVGDYKAWNEQMHEKAMKENKFLTCPFYYSAVSTGYFVFTEKDLK